MKFLKDERIEREDGEVKLTLKPVTTSQQAHLIELGSVAGPIGRIALTRWCLKNVVEKISIGGAQFEPAQLADEADLGDSDTYLVMLKIGVVVCDASIASGDDVKK